METEDESKDMISVDEVQGEGDYISKNRIPKDKLLVNRKAHIRLVIQALQLTNSAPGVHDGCRCLRARFRQKKNRTSDLK